ncbi:MAG: esterase-like activity of phytase family protein [Gaiellales bacterium]
MKRIAVSAIVVGALVVSAVAVATVVIPPKQATLAADRIPLGEGLGRTWYLGGFSGLAPITRAGDEYWTITDRGPNLDEGQGNTCVEDGKVYPLPGFAPEIVRVAVSGAELKVVKRIPLKFSTGPAVGYSVRPAPKNEASFGPACELLGTSPRGIDSEGLVVDKRNGGFWIADEYLPSIMHVTDSGKVDLRIVPVGTASFVDGAGAKIVEGFPAGIGQWFRPNRGFEGIAISGDGKSVYTALQSPMEYRPPTPSPDPRSSLALRVFKIDIRKAKAPAVVAQWLYPLDKSPTANKPLADKVSELIWLEGDKLLVEERDDPTSDFDNPQNTVNTRLYLADFASATAIPADSKWNGAASPDTGDKTAEQWYIPGQVGAPADLPVAASKCLWADVAAMLRTAGFTDPNDPTVPPRAGNGKLEGIAYIPANGLLAVVNDNDFGIFSPIPEQLNVVPVPAGCVT